MKAQRVFLPLVAVILVCSTASCPRPNQNTGDYANKMRAFVAAISSYAKAHSPGFLIIPQNGEMLLMADGDPAGPLAAGYAAAIDGLGREDLFYGYTADNAATPLAARNEMLPFLDRAELNGIEVLATDYCWTQAFVDNSYAWSAARGYVSFAAHHRGLDAVPPYPAQPYNVNADDISQLSQAKNFLYLIDPGAFASRAAYLDALRATNHDLLIIDLFDADNAALSAADVASLKTKANGGARLVVAYLSIGEAEDYRYYWQPSWLANRPAWLLGQNPDWPGNYLVRYWNAQWQAVILGNASAYLDRILVAGFDGAYLDKVDAFESFE